MPLRVIKIAVDQAAYHFDKLYSYTVPESLGPVERGCRVLVPFGGGNRKRQGVVVELDGEAEVAKLKPVFSVLDPKPLLDDEMMDLALWIKERTFCTVFDVVRAMLPTGFSMKIRPVYRARVLEPDEADTLPLEEKLMAEFIAAHKNGIDREKLLTALGYDDGCRLPEILVEKGIAHRTDDAYRLTGDATVRMVRLGFELEALEDKIAVFKCTDKQKAVLRLMAEVGCASVKEACYFTSVTPAVVTALERKGLLEYYDEEVLRSPHRQAPSCPELASSVLNGEQQQAFESLLKTYKSGKPACALLYGVTGSGKTQVYMNLINQVLEDGKQVLVMVPEISLTPQMMSLFLNQYGSRVAVLHSALSMGERMDEWKRIKRGDAKIVVGTRSAVFAPCSNLGLIVMDEEQEHTYKSESSPRYHARDIAKFRCARHQALLLLTSATPSVESFHAAQTGRYALCSLTSRYGDAQLPAVEVVDMRAEAAEDNILSGQLRREMEECLGAGRQVILLLNRRGYNTFVSCRSCGHVITCPSCSISMTYHHANRQLVCHYCGHMQEAVRICPECGSDKIRYSGLGTQRVEEKIEELFPGEKILRMDTDTTMSRFAYEKKFNQFASGQYSIMIGTQMVAKGLDFPNVGLVGVLSADQALYGDDYRCFETTFSLLTQVIGRAGRRDVEGKAVIQTYTPENYVIELASHQDYEGFYAIEIAARKMMKYPPYADLCLFGFVGQAEDEVRDAAVRFLRLLRQTATAEYPDVPLIALDPTPAVVAKVAGKYRYKVLVKIIASSRSRKMIGDMLIRFGRQKENGRVTVYADMNPAGML
mgnify:FL=1